MTKRDACRTPQTSILTRHEADKTGSGSEMGCPSEHMLCRGGGGGQSTGERQLERAGEGEAKGLMQGMIRERG